MEWSGILYYRVKEGSIEKLDELVLEAFDVYPMDMGTGSYTEYEVDTSVAGYMMKNPHLMAEDVRQGHIHSHNNMGVFFSTTDVEELEDNAPKYNYYLSLIVNNKYELKARIAQYLKYEDKITRSLTYIGETGQPVTIDKNFTEQQESVFMYPCTIFNEEPEIEIPETFKDRVDKIIEISEERKKRKQAGFRQARNSNTTTGGKTYGTSYGQMSGYPGYQGAIYFGDIDDEEIATDGEVKKQLVKWLSFDQDATDVSLSEIVSHMNKEFEDKDSLDHYLLALESAFFDFVGNYEINNFIDSAQSILDKYETELGIELFNLMYKLKEEARNFHIDTKVEVDNNGELKF